MALLMLMLRAHDNIFARALPLPAEMIYFVPHAAALAAAMRSPHAMMIFATR